MNIAHMFPKLNSGKVVVITRKTGKLYVIVLFLNVYFQGMFFNRLEFTMVAKQEDSHVLCSCVCHHSALPFGLKIAHVAAKDQLLM